MHRKVEFVSRRWNITTRIIIASFVSYVLVNLIGITFVSISSQQMNEAILSASLLSFPFYVLIIMWTFSGSNIKRIFFVQTGLIIILAIFNFLIVSYP